MTFQSACALLRTVSECMHQRIVNKTKRRAEAQLLLTEHAQHSAARKHPATSTRHRFGQAKRIGQTLAHLGHRPSADRSQPLPHHLRESAKQHCFIHTILSFGVQTQSSTARRKKRKNHSSGRNPYHRPHHQLHRGRTESRRTPKETRNERTSRRGRVIRS